MCHKRFGFLTLYRRRWIAYLRLMARFTRSILCNTSHWFCCNVAFWSSQWTSFARRLTLRNSTLTCKEAAILVAPARSAKGLQSALLSLKSLGHWREPKKTLRLFQQSLPSYRVYIPYFCRFRELCIVLYGKSQIQSCIDNRNLSKSSTSLSATWRTTTVQARANSTKTTTRCLWKCFTIMSGKVNSYKGEQIIITTQTNYLKATTKRNQRKRWK